MWRGYRFGSVSGGQFPAQRGHAFRRQQSTADTFALELEFPKGSDLVTLEEQLGLLSGVIDVSLARSRSGGVNLSQEAVVPSRIVARLQSEELDASYGVWQDKEVSKVMWWWKETVRPKDGKVDSDEVQNFADFRRAVGCDKLWTLDSANWNRYWERMSPAPPTSANPRPLTTGPALSAVS